jgi:hypothetical protein
MSVGQAPTEVAESSRLIDHVLPASFMVAGASRGFFPTLRKPHSPQGRILKMMRATSFLLPGSLVLAVASCGVAIRSAGSFAPGANIDRYATFAWNQEGDRAVGDPRLENNRFFEDRLHEAIDWELSLRGIRQDESSPDLLVHHHLSLANHELVEEVIDESGYSQSEVLSYEEGTVVVHLVDARTGEDLWIGWGQANVEPAFAGPDSMERWVYNLVGRMFEGWPAPDRSGPS